MTTLTHLECSACRERYEAGALHNLCRCGGVLLARYDLETARQSWNREWTRNGPASMWRYAPVLPVRQPSSIVTLGEGMTPLLQATRLGARLGAQNLWIKDEGLNPTGSFKARGLACAVSMAVELGVRQVAMPSAGNAGGALAAYAAAAGIEAHIFMPADVPQANYLECRAYGAHTTLVNGLIGDCGRVAAAHASAEGWFQMSTLKEPYRVEGKKTMAYEVAEQLGWTLPDAILYPAGGGVGLIGMWKAFEELEQLGWTAGKRPRMIAVQAEGCQPIVRALERGESKTEPFENAATVASGLRVPDPLGGALILSILRESGGTAVAVSDRGIIEAALELAACEGILAAPEGAACVPAVRRLLANGFLKPEERVVLFNTGSGLKYPELYTTRFPRHIASEQDKLGGLITPR